MTELNYTEESDLRRATTPSAPVDRCDIQMGTLIRYGTWACRTRCQTAEHRSCRSGQTATVTATYRMEEQDADLQTLYKILPTARFR